MLLNSEVKHFWKILTALLLLSASLKLLFLSHPKDFYFDEVYHAFTATYYLQGHSESYGLYHKAPEGKAVEWTHPPLAKLAMFGSMAIFGENSFGWRFPSVLFGTGILLFAALLALELGFAQSAILFAVFFLSIEGLIFTQSRIGMNDAVFVCFAYVAFWLYAKWRNDPDRLTLVPLIGVALGLAAATKWSTLFVFAVIGVDLLVGLYRDQRLRSFLKFIVATISLTLVPVAVYAASYLHAIYLGFTWDHVWELQRQMWGYHTGLKATHPYKSVPYQWIFNLRPVWMWVDYSTPGKIANIYNIGNSVILYLGLISILVFIKDLFQRWRWQLWFVVLAYFMVWLPWSFSPRIMLFYHYTPAIPMLCLALGEITRRLLERRHNLLAALILILSFGWFAVFYPHHVGIPVDAWIVQNIYQFLPGWK